MLYNYSASGIQVNNEQIVAAANVSLAHDCFFDVEIYTAPNKGGTKLIENTNYTLGDYDTVWQGYNSIRFITNIGQTLYVYYKTHGDYIDTTDINALETNINTHKAATSGTHGVSGNIVGTSDTQTLTNKTLGSGTKLGADLDANNKAITNCTTISTIQSDISTIQTNVSTIQADLSSHKTTKTGIHGVSGDVVGTSDTQTLTNKTLGSGTKLDADLDANGKAITNCSTITTIQTNISTVQTDLSNHKTATTGTHGVTGTIVGTSDTQTLTNKTLSDNVKVGTNFIITPSPTATTSWKGANLITVPSQLPMQRAKLKVYPVTVVNLSGRLGNFENEFSSGFNVSSLNTTYSFANDKVVVGNTSLCLTKPISSDTGIQIRTSGTLSDPLTIGNKYFFSVWVYTTKTMTGACRFEVGKSPYDVATLQGAKTANQFNKLFCSISVNYTGYIYLTIVQEDASTATYVWLDGYMVVDLTRMGVLPPPLKEYFNNVPSTWADLATASNIAAIDGKVQSGNAWLNELLPYVNGVATLGYAWGM